MRELKFRAINKDDLKRGFFDALSHRTFTLKGLIAVPSIEIMQYTGLMDYNGTHIYEGDILKCKANAVINKEEIKEYDNDGDIFDFGPDAKYEIRYYCNEVQWFAGNHHGYRMKRGRYTCELKQGTIINMVAEVVGNIFQNPELLK